MIAAFIRCETDTNPLCLSEIGGRPALGHVLDRVRMARRVHAIYLLTSDRESDDHVARFCEGEAIGYFRVKDGDILLSLQKAASSVASEAAVYLLADCPLVDPHLVERVVSRYLRGDVDYVSTAMERTFPLGMDVEIFRTSALELALRYVSLPAEHQDPSLYLRKGGKFRRANVTFSRTEKCEDMDWRFHDADRRPMFETIMRALSNHPDYTIEDIIALMQTDPARTVLGGGRIVKCRE